MSVSSQAGRQGLKAFRLAEVPEGIRLRAKERLLRTPGTAHGLLMATADPLARLAIGAAAERPSERVYWISREAWERVMGP